MLSLDVVSTLVWAVTEPEAAGAGGLHSLDIIWTLTGGLAAALLFGYVTQRLGLSPIVGYLLAGVAVGPFTPGFFVDLGVAEQFAEVGVILLMFGVGLHFHLDDLLAVRKVAIPGAVGQSLFATALGVATAVTLGWGWQAGVVFGLAISVASTVVLVRVLADHNDLHTPSGHIAVGWLVVEDLFTVLVLVLLPALFGAKQATSAQLPLVIGLSLAKIVVLALFAFVVGGRVLPWLLTKVAETRSRELFTLTTLAVALGIAVGAAKFFDASMALGAFLAGMVVGRSDFSLRAAAEALPMRDAFAVLFFVSVGMRLDPGQLLAAPHVLALTLAIVMLGKPLAALVIVLVLGYPVRTALAVAVALAQIGEFSFILADLGMRLGIFNETSAAAYNSMVAAAIVSISFNALIYRRIDAIEAWLRSKPRVWRWLTRRAPAAVAADESDFDTLSPRHRAVVVGYGPVGRTLSRLLRENEIEPVIIEMNLATVQRLRKEGMHAVYGDATHRDTLESAGVAHSASLFLTSSGLPGAQDVIRLAREINPEIRIVVRTSYLHERTTLRDYGATKVFSGEGEVALAMTEYLLSELGATAEQMDRERERLRADLFGPPRGSSLFAPSPLFPDPPPAAAPSNAEMESADPKNAAETNLP